MRVDAHVHLWPPGTAVVGGPPALSAYASLEVVAATLGRVGVGAAIYVQPAVLGLDHSYLLNALGDGRMRAVGIAQVDPQDPRSLEVISELTREALIVGIRLPLLRADETWVERHAEEYWQLAAAEEEVISLLIHPNQLTSVQGLSAAHRSVPVVIDHLARFDLAGDGDQTIDRLCELSSLPNVHVKASAFYALGSETWPHRDVWPRLSAVVDAFGIRRIMWGSDYPFVLAGGPYVNSCRAVEMALRERHPEGATDVMGGNALRLFFPSVGRAA